MEFGYTHRGQLPKAVPYDGRVPSEAEIVKIFIPHCPQVTEEETSLLGLTDASTFPATDYYRLEYDTHVGLDTNTSERD